MFYNIVFYIIKIIIIKTNINSNNKKTFNFIGVI